MAEDQKQQVGFTHILGPINELLILKNAKYGKSFDKTRKEYGETAFLLRLEDKFNRLKNLVLSGDVGTEDERVEDTIQDIIGYCTLELNYRQENKEAQE